MSGKITNRIWNESRQKGSALLLLLAIADYGTGAYPSVRTLARKVRLSEYHCRRLLHRIKEDGELKRFFGFESYPAGRS